ncbi:MAG TPA: sigma 54-interacting transcriptional regulator [Candidatus Brocadiia bacterium]|nr:sigma 54-interacting transcriptional regulator [Candidatus Brocadiia bacterium]
MPKILVKEGPSRGAQIEIEGETALVGRSPRCEVFLPDATVSREHAKFYRKGDAWKVQDLDSRNGSLLNGHAIKDEDLCHMDEIRVGDCLLTFLSDEVELEEAVSPEDLSVTQTIQIQSDGDVVPGDGGRKSGEELARQNERLRALLRLSSAVSKARNLPELFDHVCQCLREALEPDRVVPFIEEPDGKLTPYARARTAIERRLLRQSLSNSIIDHCHDKKVSVLSQATGSDERFSAAPSVGRNRISTALCAPLQIAGRMLGLIYMDRLGECVPFTRDDLELLTAACQQSAVAVENVRAYELVEAENRALEREVKGRYNIVGNSPKIVEVFNVIARAAPTDACVLICGESGTGKELVARAIHYNSRRRSGPFEIVNCAALSPSLIESELFGHVKGAFTGAVADHPGHFELATGGTIFLDEIGEIPEQSQSKLLRVLEESTVRRVGDVRDRKIDVRIVAATNRRLDEMVKERKFREDLFYRLNVLRVDLPPLREREKDIQTLSDYFLAQTADRCGRKFKGLAQEVLDLFAAYPWPGNVRELRNTIERMVILAENETIGIDDAPVEIRRGRSPVAAEAAAEDSGPVCSLAELEQRHILRVLRHVEGNKSRCAEILGIDRSTLYQKLKFSTSRNEFQEH